MIPGEDLPEVASAELGEAVDAHALAELPVADDEQAVVVAGEVAEYQPGAIEQVDMAEDTRRSDIAQKHPLLADAHEQRLPGRAQHSLVGGALQRLRLAHVEERRHAGPGREGASDDPRDERYAARDAERAEALGKVRTAHHLPRHREALMNDDAHRDSGRFPNLAQRITAL